MGVALLLVPFAVMLLLPGPRSVAAAIGAFCLLAWFTWPQCMSPECSEGRSFHYAFFSVIVQGLGGGVVTRIAQVFLLPPKAWALRLASGVIGAAISTLTYSAIWFPGLWLR